ncbi:hypothetical protein NVS55_22435 [Myxococcus stipitatus]|uniref:hypothetical protein n=1 Tax=Myxococcus stipitatus TaxID=83455 RepID=UPI0031450B2B
MPPTFRVVLRTFATLPLLLTACGDDNRPSYIRVNYPNGVMQFDGTPDPQFAQGLSNQFRLCAVNDPSPEAVYNDDETTACVHLRISDTALQTGPKEFKIAGTAVISPADPGTIPAVAFTAGATHSPEVQMVYISTICFGPGANQDTRQEVTGTLVLKENSQTKLKGRVVLQVKGTTADRCTGGDSEANLRFESEP